MAFWTQIHLLLSSQDAKEVIDQWKDLPEYDGSHKNTVWFKFSTRRDQTRKITAIKDRINKIPPSKGRKFFARWSDQ